MVSKPGVGIAGALFLIFAALGVTTQLTRSATPERPLFQVDPAWPKVPNGWALGQVSSAAADANDHVWLLHRSRVVRAGQKTGPPVMEFDAAGNYLQGWGGPGDGFEWPRSEHGIFVDYRGFVWIGGNGDDDQILKFTKAGQFVMQIGRGSERRQRRHAKPVEAGRRLRPSPDQRAVRRRRLRQPAHHRVRRRHGGVQTHVGRLRQRAGG